MNRKWLLMMIAVTVAVGVLLVGLALAQENYCRDPDSWTQWNELLAKYPQDLELHALHALRLGICLKIERGDITLEQGIDIFDRAREVLIRKRGAEDKRKKPES